MNSELAKRARLIYALRERGNLLWVALLLELGEPEESSEPRRRATHTKEDPKLSWWWTTYHVDKAGVYRSPQASPHKARQFRHRFRMSRKALDDLIALCREHKWFEAHDLPSRNHMKRRAPLELLIMGSLAVLGGTVSFEMLQDVTHIAGSTHRAFFEEFVTAGAKHFFPLMVVPPSTEEEIRASMLPYTGAGVPGCFCSCDAVRIRCWAVNHNLRNENIGKEGFPTKTFQLSCGYNGRVFSCTRAHSGKEPDVTITKTDLFLLRVRNDPLFTNLEWDYIKQDGTAGRSRGAWVLVDNGYPPWVELQCPPKHVSEPEELQWREMMESLRKDIERVFGIIKQRFRILKLGLSFQKMGIVEKLFHTCVALHNFLLSMNDEKVDFSKPLEGARIYQAKLKSDYIPKGKREPVLPDPAYLERRRLLIHHFQHKLQRKEVRWPGKENSFIARRLNSFGKDLGEEVEEQEVEEQEVEDVEPDADEVNYDLEES